MFLCLAYFALVQFTKTHKADSPEYEPPTDRKMRRNAWYRWCGGAILLSLGLAFVYIVVLEGRWPKLDRVGPIYFLEAAMLWSFGTAWVIKGRALTRWFADLPRKEITEKAGEQQS